MQIIKQSKWASRLLFSCVLLVLAAVSASAQFRAAVQGTVTDNSGSIIPDATVTLTNKDTNQTMKTATNDSGFYRFSGLAPGNYALAVEKQGFKRNVLAVVVSAEQLTGIDVSLTAGVISEVVNVNAVDEAVVQSEDANIRRTITNAEVLALPQPGRDPYELARLTPGVFGSGARTSSGGGVRFPNSQGPGASTNSIFATENVQPISANGQRSSANNYQIDGVSVNSQTWGGAVITPSQESVKEVVVTSSTYSAEDGRNSGAQIRVTSQNGANQFHGSAFLKINDPSLNAFNTMPKLIGTIDTGGPTRVERKFKSYGGSLGGPIRRDRLFFFFTYEGMREDSNNTYTSLIDTSTFRSAILGARANTVSARVLQAAGIEPRIVQILTPTCTNIFITCAVAGQGMDIGSITGAYGQYVSVNNSVGGGLDGIADVQWAKLENPYKFRGNQYSTRIDFQATAKDRITFSSYIVPFNQTLADTSAQSRPQADVISKRLSFAFGAIYNRAISSTMYNEARFNVTRWGFDEVASNPNAALGLPRVEIESVFSGRIRYGFPSGLNTPGVINEKQFEFSDTFTKVIGNIVMKVGAQYRRDVNSNTEVGGARPVYSFFRPWNFANGTPIYEGITATLQGKPTTNNIKFKTSELAFFLQNDWKARPDLTVNLGLRWSYYSPITAMNGVLGNLIVPSDLNLANASISTSKRLFKNDFNNFGPQIGFAWSPKWFDNKAVVRGGFGMGYDRLGNNVLAAARRNPPNGALFGICCGTATGDWGDGPFRGGQIQYVASGDGTIYGYPVNTGIGGGARSNGLPVNGAVEIWGSPQDMPTATVYRYSLEGQYEIAKSIVATLGYQGSQGRNFVRINRVHILATQQNQNISAVYFAEPDVHSDYNAAIFRLQGRVAKQFSWDMNYRFAKSLDTSSYEGASGNADQTYPVDQKQEYGPSDFDVRHSFVMSGTWDIPLFTDRKKLSGKILGGWQVSAITTWNSGFPWTPLLFGCLNGSTSNSSGFCDPRPTALATGRTSIPTVGNSNDAFLRPGGVFGVGGTTIFSTTFNGSNPFQNPPVIGRNALRGPRYFAVDMTIAKKFGLGNWGILGENANIDVRFNFFNLLNNLNLSPIVSREDATRIQSDRFGLITNGLSGRVGEFQIRFNF